MSGWLMQAPTQPVEAHAQPPRLGSALGQVVSPSARLECLYDQATWTEGPAWWRGQLVFSDVVGRRVLT